MHDDVAYRRWLLVGLAFALIAGAGGGTWLTLCIASAKTITAIPDFRGFIILTNASAHALIVGWMGVFLVACAEHVLPRHWDSPMRPSIWIPCALASGAAVHALAEVLIDGWLAVIAMRVGSMAELVATIAFAARLSAVARGAANGGGLAVPGAWFLVAAVAFDGWHAPRAAMAHSASDLIRVVSTWQATLRDLQLHGAALCLLLALAGAIFAPVTAAPSACMQAWIERLIVGGTCIEVVCFLAYRLGAGHVFAAALIVPWSALSVGSFLATARWRWWRWYACDSPTLACRMACAWLITSLAMHFGFAYLFSIGRPFSHVYFAAMGQAAALGFVAQMVMALITATSVVGQVRQRGTLIAFNIALAVMLAALIGTDWNPAAATALGIAGVAVGVALAAWCVRAGMRLGVGG